MPLIAEVSTAQTLFLTTSRAFPNAHAALEGSYTTVLSDTGRAPHRTTAHIIVQVHHSATMPRRRHTLIVAALATAAALRQPPRRIAAEKTLRVLIADVGDEVQWLPGDRRTIRRPSPSQAAALNAAAAEALFSESPALVAMLPTVAQEEYPQNDEAVLAPGGGGRRVRYQEGVHDEGTRRDGQSAFRRAFMDAKQTSSGLRVAALCAVRGVRTAGSREAKGVRPIIERATLEVVGRVAVKRLEVLAEKDEAYWSDDKAAGGTGLVAAVGGSAVLQDAWVDEIKQSPVHAVHRLRPLADDCARFHDLIRERLRDTSDAVWKSTSWLRRTVRNRHCHAIE